MRTRVFPLLVALILVLAAALPAAATIYYNDDYVDLGHTYWEWTWTMNINETNIKQAFLTMEFIDTDT